MTRKGHVSRGETMNKYQAEYMKLMFESQEGTLSKALKYADEHIKEVKQ